MSTTTQPAAVQSAKVVYSFRVDPLERKRFQRLADRMGVTFSEAVRTGLLPLERSRDAAAAP
jgi:antitoxin component of RelBE/YafQ-DinJ toxin-antitoxin module